MSVSICHLALADIESLRACMNAVGLDRNFLAIMQAPLAQPLESQVRKGFEEDDVHIVARVEQRVVGWAQIHRGRGAAVAHRGNLGMGVSPAYRGQGLGKRLLMTCIGAAAAKGIANIELEVRADNRCALKLYRSVGFTTEAIVRDAMLIDGVFHSAFRMSLML